MRQSRLLIRTAVLAIATMAFAVSGWLATSVGSAAATPTPTPAPTQPLPAPTVPATGTPLPQPTVAASPTPAPAPPPGSGQESGHEQPEQDGDNGLPVTGAQVGGMVVLGGGLVAAGIAMAAVRRRDLSDFDLAG